MDCPQTSEGKNERQVIEIESSGYRRYICNCDTLLMYTRPRGYYITSAFVDYHHGVLPLLPHQDDTTAKSVAGQLVHIIHLCAFWGRV